MKGNSHGKNKILQCEREGSMIKTEETDKADVTVTETNSTRENYPVLHWDNRKDATKERPQTEKVPTHENDYFLESIEIVN